MAEKRIEYIDFIKGICMFLVVWGHTVQNMGDGIRFWENPVHIFICSFHMPIFMLVSGFFFSKSLKDSLLVSTKKRFIRLIIPCFGWSLILLFITTGYQLYDGISISIIERIKSLFYGTGTQYWFLRSVFICYTLATISMKIFKKDTTAFLISFILFLLLPDNGRLHLDKFMYPFFWCGYFMHKHIEFILEHRIKLLIGSFSLFVILIAFWQKEFYIYITGMAFYELAGSQIKMYDLIPHLNIITYRYLIGLAGSILIFLCLQWMYSPKCKWIEKMGTYTLGIYTIHIIIEGNLLSKVDLSSLNEGIYNFIVTPLVSILLIVLCIGIVRLIEYNKYLRFLFLGETYKTNNKKQIFNVHK